MVNARIMAFNRCAVSVGDKVIPHDKTVPGYKGLDTCICWETALADGQHYLYIVDILEETGATVYLLHYSRTCPTGNYYNREDFRLLDRV
jgi:hypothetical protein